MNYTSIDEILASDTTNMNVLRDNTKQDDGTDVITGVDWFTFNGTIASIIYASGNSWLGFGSSSEHLKVNRQDGAMWSLYREEGTLYNYYKFLKIRWSGYTFYNQTSTSYKLEYDVILWDTGDISLHIVTWPTSYNTGTYSLAASSTYTYTVSSSSMDITFKKTDSGFEVQNNVIVLEMPYAKRYLLRDGATIYTVIDGILSSLDASEVTSDLFLNSGTEVIPDFSLLNSLNNPELLYWHEIEDVITELIVYGAPTLPQIVHYEIQTIPEGKSVSKMEANISEDVVLAITFDNGATWQYYQDNAWVAASSISEGMTAHTLKNIQSDTWAEIVASSTYQVRCILPSLTSTAGSLAVEYI